MEVLILHVDCKGDAIRVAQDNMDSRNFYGYNPEFDKVTPEWRNRR